MNSLEIVKTLPKHMQALYSDAILFFSEDPTIATPQRKALVLDDIQFIRSQLDALEKVIG